MHKIRKNMQDICRKYESNVQGIFIEFAINMHKYACICIEYAKHMQTYANHIQNIAEYMLYICNMKEYANNIHKYAIVKYA